MVTCELAKIVVSFPAFRNIYPRPDDGEGVKGCDLSPVPVLDGSVAEVFCSELEGRGDGMPFVAQY